MTGVGPVVALQGGRALAAGTLGHCPALTAVALRDSVGVAASFAFGWDGQRLRRVRLTRLLPPVWFLVVAFPRHPSSDDGHDTLAVPASQGCGFSSWFRRCLAVLKWTQAEGPWTGRPGWGGAFAASPASGQWHGAACGRAGRREAWGEDEEGRQGAKPRRAWGVGSIGCSTHAETTLAWGVLRSAKREASQRRARVCVAAGSPGGDAPLMVVAAPHDVMPSPRRRPWLARPPALDHLAVVVVTVPAHSMPAPVRGAAHVHDAVDVEGALPRRDARLLAVLPLVWPEAGLGEKGLVAVLAVDVKVKASDVLVGRLPQLGLWRNLRRLRLADVDVQVGPVPAGVGNALRRRADPRRCVARRADVVCAGQVIDLWAVDHHRVHLHVLEHQRWHQAEQQGAQHAARSSADSPGRRRSGRR